MLLYPCSLQIRKKGSDRLEQRAIIQDGIDYIESNLKAEITAAELAERAGFSLYHYYKLFQAETGMPVMQFILRRRLLHAIVMIENGSAKTEAALEYGFDTYAGFYKAFVREMGCTPAEYIQKNRVRKPCRFDLEKEEHMINSYYTPNLPPPATSRRPSKPWSTDSKRATNSRLYLVLPAPVRPLPWRM